jgi:hypothetical protein
MKLKLSEASQLCDWTKFCDMTGLDYYCMTWCDTESEIELTIEQAQELGIIESKSSV